MMHYIAFFLMLCLFPLGLNGQIALQTEEQRSGYTALPDERTYVHANTSFLLTGEYLYYKVYCFDAETRDLSKLSKVAYVVLIGQGGEQIFRHKIVLNSGQGYGDFFVPTEVASGVYKLLAYTQWMHNKDQADFFQLDVTILNPYRSNQAELQKTVPIRIDSVALSTKDGEFKSPASATDKTLGPLALKVSKTQLGKREQVTVALKGVRPGQDIAGTYSLSVRKRETTRPPLLAESMNDFTDKEGSGTTALPIGDRIILPELRGELFQGEVIPREDGYPVNDLKIGISIPGEDYVLEVLQTNAEGKFYLNVAKPYSGELMFAQVLSNHPEHYEIRMLEPLLPDYRQLDFKPIDIDYSMREAILKRSIHNQIENSYFQFRPDSIVSPQPKLFFDNQPKKTYVLADYTRFKTLRETFVEIVQDVSSKRLDKDDYAIRVKGYDYATVTDIPPLLLLDGRLIQDHNALLNFDARKIKTIEVFRDTFVFGPAIYEGAIVITTDEGSGYELLPYDRLLFAFDLLQPQVKKNYFVQRYGSASNGTSARLPDDRLQLLWIPELNIVDEGAAIDFYTSDVPGEFEIRLEGTTKEGDPVSIVTVIVVE